MRTFRMIIIMVTLFIGGGTTVTSCQDKTSQTNASASASTDKNDKSIDANSLKMVLDSISNVNTRLTTNITDLNKTIQENNSKMDEIKKSSAMLTWIALGLAILSLIIAVFSILIINNVNGRASRHRKEIEMLKSSSPYKSTSSHACSPASTISISEFKSLSNKVSKIERMLNQQQYVPKQPMAVSTPQQVIKNTPVASPNINTNPAKHGYFGLPSQISMTDAYFKKLFESRDPDARFDVIVRNDKAEFKLLEGQQYFNDLKSNDAIKMAIDIEGCAPSEATRMTIILPGEAHKEGDRWIITKKTQIALTH